MPAEEEEKKADPNKKGSIRPDWKDYIALTIAALESTMLPFILLIILLVTLAFIFTHLAP